MAFSLASYALVEYLGNIKSWIVNISMVLTCRTHANLAFIYSDKEPRWRLGLKQPSGFKWNDLKWSISRDVMNLEKKGSNWYWLGKTNVVIIHRIQLTLRRSTVKSSSWNKKIINQWLTRMLRCGAEFRPNKSHQPHYNKQVDGTGESSSSRGAGGPCSR